MSAALRSVGLLDAPSSAPPGPSVATPCRHARLHRLATDAGGECGFTLLEVLVSLSILAVTLMLTYRVISGAISASDRSERWTAAAYLAEGMVLDAVDEFPGTTETEGKFKPPYDSYSWKRTVRAAAHPDAVEVEVIVSWTSDGKEEQVSVTGLSVKK